MYPSNVVGVYFEDILTLTPNKATGDHLIYYNINELRRKLLMKSLRHIVKRLCCMKSNR